MAKSDSPIAHFIELLEKAKKTELFDATACVLATCDKNAKPSARWILLKGATEIGFQFFSNYKSKKAKELENNANAALAFHWHTLGVQVRVEGQVTKLSEEESNAYFQTRPRQSQIGAWASKQSAPLQHSEMLINRVQDLIKRFEDKTIPRPDFWGGFNLTPSMVEFWYNRDFRLHDRVQYSKTSDGWATQNLYP